jgi:hypothetical protein
MIIIFGFFLLFYCKIFLLWYKIVDIEIYVIISKKPIGKQLKSRYKSNKNNFVYYIPKNKQ